MKNSFTVITLIVITILLTSCIATKQGEGEFDSEFFQRLDEQMLIAEQMHVDAICENDLKTIEADAEIMVRTGLYTRKCPGIFNAAVNIRGVEIQIRKLPLQLYRHKGATPLGLLKKDVEAFGELFWHLDSAETKGIIVKGSTKWKSEYFLFETGRNPLIILHEENPNCTTKNN